MLAVERLLSTARVAGRFSIIQWRAEPLHIGTYRRFVTEVKSMEERINGRFGGGGYLPIILKIKQHTTMPLSTNITGPRIWASYSSA